jgi:hypothetical protein
MIWAVVIKNSNGISIEGEIRDTWMWLKTLNTGLKMILIKN